jgi:non-specific serine/threonine protein kinase/serine/threonine-protein kinase
MSEEPPPEDPTESESVEELPSSPEHGQIGPFRLLQKLGEGGMGEVFLAEQIEPVRRRVALKIIKWGMDTKAVVARFEGERQALAMMSHPNVAKVFDAGATTQGRPYFVMELVKGESITEYCDRQRLTTPERLELFKQVCEGLQHAHQKGIIHRDIKPSNILVQIEGDKPTPKIIDFGVAKATEQRLTEKTVFTELGQVIGTPEYMSPEQAEMTVQDIDTRTDVYSLGVLLYELLVGALPFDPQELRRAGFDEIRRRIREDDPSKPSTRVSTLGDASADSARKRRTDPHSLARQLRGDLDWITMKALEKDRIRRYGSAYELAADIDRHLRDDAVLASPPSAAYRAGKFVRRHRTGVLLATLAVVFLAGVAVRERVQFNRIAKERDRAAREAATASQALDFMVEMFEVSDPCEARGNSVTAREILDQGASRIVNSLEGQPEVRARLMGTMGRVYAKLGLYGQAEPLFDEALETWRNELGENHPSTLCSMSNLANLYVSQGRHAEAEPLYLETLESERPRQGDVSLCTLQSMSGLAMVYRSQGRYDEAEPLYLEALEAKRRALGNDDPGTLRAMHSLASLYRSQARHDEAETLQLEALEIQRRVLGDDHPDTLLSMNGLATTYRSQGRYDEAEPLYLEALEARKRVLGPDHRFTIGSMSGLASLYSRQGRYDEAEPLLRGAVEVRKRTLGDDAPRTLCSMDDLAVLYLQAGRHAEVESLLLEVVGGLKDGPGVEDARTRKAMGHLAYLYKVQRRYDEAEPLYLEVLETRQRLLGDDHPQTLEGMNDVALLYEKQRRYDEAEAFYRRTLETRQRVLGDDHLKTLGSMNNLAGLFWKQRRYDEAEPLYRAALAARRRALGEDHRVTLQSKHNLAILYWKQGRYDEAEQLYRETYEARQRVLGDDHPETLDSIYDLACYQAVLGTREEALRLLGLAVDRGWAEELVFDDPDLASLRGDPEFEALLAEVRRRIGGD